MPHKIIKATLPTLTLGVMVGVAQADVLDDAINNAKDAVLQLMCKRAPRKYLANLKLTG